MQSTSKTKREEFARAVDAAARDLVKVEHRPDGSFVTTPLIYPSGANVLVRIEPASAAEYFVSDYGLGFSECDMLGATHQFKRHAPMIAQNAGVGFDSNAFFVAKVGLDQLTGAAAAIANCSLEAVSTAALKLSERRFADDAAQLNQRLIAIFTEKFVSKDVPVAGASQTVWHVANIVRSRSSDEPHVTIFEPVTMHHASIVTAVTKFHDIARLDHAPRRVAVVKKKIEFGTYLEVLAQAADVVSSDVSNATIERLAA